MQKADGAFVVQMRTEEEKTDGDTSFGRYTFFKKFSGDLSAASTVEMLSGGSGATAAGAYVAMERVEGILSGKHGSFLLVHRGFRNETSMSLEVTVVPGCGTDELQGLEGKMEIRIEGEQHFYEFEYEIRE